MMFYIKFLSIVVAVSLDGFGVGMTYGMSKTRIQLSGFIFIVCCSGLIVLLSMTIGHFITRFIPSSITGHIASFILIGLRSFVLLYILRQKYVRKKPKREQSHILRRLTSILEDP